MVALALYKIFADVMKTLFVQLQSQDFIFSASFLKCLKVPKCENFHRTDFFDFYTIKPLWVGDFRAKNKNYKFLYLWGLFEVSFPKILC
jgi:hypothetical protein